MQLEEVREETRECILGRSADCEKPGQGSKLHNGDQAEVW